MSWLARRRHLRRFSGTYATALRHERIPTIIINRLIITGAGTIETMNDPAMASDMIRVVRTIHERVLSLIRNNIFKYVPEDTGALKRAVMGSIYTSRRVSTPTTAIWLLQAPIDYAGIVNKMLTFWRRPKDRAVQHPGSHPDSPIYTHRRGRLLRDPTAEGHFFEKIFNLAIDDIYRIYSEQMRSFARRHNLGRGGVTRAKSWMRLY